MFEDNLSYAQIVERAQAEFGVEVTKSSLGRFYQWHVRERNARELAEAHFTAFVVNAVPDDPHNLRNAAVKMVGKAAMKIGSEKPEATEQLVSLTELLLDAEHNDLRRGKLELEQRSFDYEKTVATLKELPQTRAYLTAIVRDTSLSDQQRTEKIRDLFFRWVKEAKAGKEK
jgi:hypothetical protein